MSSAFLYRLSGNQEPFSTFFHSTICDEKEYQEKQTLIIENSFLEHTTIVNEKGFFLEGGSIG